MKRIALLLSLILVLTMVTACSSGQSGGKFPNNPVTLVTYSSVGGGGDIASRMLSELCSSGNYLPQKMLVENIPGAGTITGIEHVAKAKADGYTILFITKNFCLAPYNQNRPELAPPDVFDPIISLTREPSMIVVRADSPYNTFQDLIDYGKANPGKLLWGGTGPADQMVINSIEQAAGIKVSYMQYEGGSDSTVALVGGHIDVITNGPPETMSFVESGDLKYLAIASDKRFNSFPDVPIVDEFGLDIPSGDTYRGLVAPKGTPKEVVDVLHDAMQKVIETDAWREFLELNGMEANDMTNEAFWEFIKEDNQICKEFFGF